MREFNRQDGMDAKKKIYGPQTDIWDRAYRRFPDFCALKFRGESL
jgi:hypothetical protein